MTSSCPRTEQLLGNNRPNCVRKLFFKYLNMNDYVGEICQVIFSLNKLKARQNGRHFANDILKWIFFIGNVYISINISLKFVPKGPINNISALFQKMAWRWLGDKPLPEPMMVSVLTHICVTTQPQWLNCVCIKRFEYRPYTNTSLELGPMLITRVNILFKGFFKFCRFRISFYIHMSHYMHFMGETNISWHNWQFYCDKINNVLS